MVNPGLPTDSADNIALTLRRRENSRIRQSVAHKLLHSLDRSDREQARIAGAVLVITIPSVVYNDASDAIDNILTK